MIPAADPKASYLALQAEIDRAIQGVLAGGRYVLGPEVAAFEEEFAAFCQASHCVSLASGTDAVALALKAMSIGPGDAVLTVSHTAVATVAAIEQTGAQAVLLDVDPASYTMDTRQLERTLKQWDLPSRPRAVVPVHLYGLPADLDAIGRLATEHGLMVLEDCAQAHGAKIGGRAVGSVGLAGAFSFYPTKNLGAFGDGGAVVTSDAELAARLRGLRQYGWDNERSSLEAGSNSRLDEIQAAILRVKLRHLDENNQHRREIAAIYDQALAGSAVQIPLADAEVNHVYHQYVIQTSRRDALCRHLQTQGVGSAIHYPRAVHQMPAYAGRVPLGPGGLPHTEALLPRILSLPMYPELSPDDARAVAQAVLSFA